MSNHVDATIALLDRQVRGDDGSMLAKVDDLELTEREDGRYEVTAILTGPGALGPRLGGRLGELWTAPWRRLRAGDRTDDQTDGSSQAVGPGRIPVADVAEWGDEVRLVPGAEQRARAAHVDGFEQWVARHVIGKIPGWDVSDRTESR